MKAYTYNDRLVGVGNDQILGTDQGGGGGTTYTAGDYISIEDDVISVTGISAGDGTLSIAQDVTGAPVNINYPTDVAPDAVLYQINSVTGNAVGYSTSTGVINYYYGETPADFNGSDDGILITVDDNISNLYSIYFYYVNSESGIGGPTLAATISADSTGTLQSGSYRVKAQYNQATSGGYGKYLEIMFTWRNYASDTAQCVQWTQEAMSKISFFGVVRPDSTLGVTVNLDRYYLGNTSTITNTSGYTQATIYTDPTTKKQTVYLPNSMPDNWTGRVAQYVQYGATRFSPGGYNTSQQYIAYKQSSSPTRYQYAFCTDYDYTNSKMTFISYNESGQAIEKWTLDYSTWNSNVWTTETISPDMSEYIPYAASGVYLPNSKFEINTNGQAYKVVSEGSEIDYNSYYDGGLCYGYWVSLPDITETPRVMKAGTYRITATNDNIKSFKFITYGNSSYSAYNGLVIPVNDNHADWIITQDIQVTTSNDTIYIYGYPNSDGTGSFIPLISSSDATVKYVIPAVSEEYITDGDLELNEDSEVTAINGHAIASESFVQVNSDWNAASGVAEILNKPTEIQLIAGANVQVEVTGASAIISAQGGGGAGYATETYVQNYVQNYTIPVEVVASSAAATGTNILYIVTGS